MLNIILNAHNRSVELEKVFKSLLNQKIDGKPSLRIVIDPEPMGINQNVVETIIEYKDRLSLIYKVSIYRYKNNVGLANAIISSLRKFNSDGQVTIVLEDDIVLLDENLVSDISSLYGELGFRGHYNLWQPNGCSKHDTITAGRHMFCWGWAADSQTIRSFTEMDELKVSLSKFLKLDFLGLDFSNHLFVNFTQKKRTWAIFYYLYIYQNNIEIYNPKKTRSAEISVSGTNRKENIFFGASEKLTRFLLNFLPPCNVSIRYQLGFLLDVRFLPRIFRSIYIYCYILIKNPDLTFKRHVEATDPNELREYHL